MRLLKKLLLSAAAMAVTALLCMVCVGAEKSGFWEYSINDDGTANITGYSGISIGKTLELPKTLDGRTVTSIGRNAFNNNQNISKVIIPSNITYIGSYAFRYSSVTEVTIPSSVVNFGYYYSDQHAFADCGNLTKVTYKAPFMPKCMFLNCAALETVVLGDTVTELGDNVFEGTTSLKNVTISKNLVKIGYAAFYNTTSLKNITLNSKLESIGSRAFQYSGVETCNFPSSLTYLGYYAFRASGIKEVTIPSSVVNFGYYYDDNHTFNECNNLTKVTYNGSYVPRDMFSNCPALKSVTIGDNVGGIDRGAFYNCGALKTVSGLKNVNYIGDYAFERTYVLNSIVMGNKVTSIGTGAFQSSGIQKVVIPSNVSFIGASAFRYSALKEVIIPSSVVSWGIYYGDSCAFANCENLKKVTIGDNIMPNVDDVFYNSPVIIYCMPNSSAMEYAKTYGIAYNTSVKRISATSISFNKESYTLRVGERLAFSPKISPANTTDCLTWKSGDENIASINSAGVLTGKSEGLVAITCQTSSGKLAYCEVTVTADEAKKTSVDTVNKKSITKARIGGISNKVYTGKAITPVPVIMYNDVTKLQKDVDFTISYSENVKVGIAKLTIKGIGKYKDSVTKTFNIVPSKIKNFKVKARTSSTLTLSWSKSSSVTGYIIEQYKGNKWVRIAKVENNATTTYKVTGLSAGTRYAFRIQGYKNVTGGAVRSSFTNKMIGYTNPKNMSGFKCGGRSDSVIRLNWTRNTSASGYIIEQYKGNKWVRIAKLENNSYTTYRVTGLSASTRYAFRIQAYKNIPGSATRSPYTDKLVVYTAPKNVSNFRASSITRNTITLSWNKNTSATGYIIEQYKDGKWVRVAKIEKNTTVSYKFTGLRANSRYVFRIQAYKNIPGSATRSSFTDKLVVYTKK